jgi:hypothetical protein
VAPRREILDPLQGYNSCHEFAAAAESLMQWATTSHELALAAAFFLSINPEAMARSSNLAVAVFGERLISVLSEVVADGCARTHLWA